MVKKYQNQLFLTQILNEKPEECISVFLENYNLYLLLKNE